MAFAELEDFATSANQEIGNFRLPFILAPDKICRDDYGISNLNWDSIHFGDDGEIGKIPNDKRGIYALVIEHPNSILSPHGYVLYIGIAGRRSNRALRVRYKDYLNEKKVIKERPALAYAIGTWQKILRFYFAPVENSFSSKNLEDLESKMNAALMPPYAKGDLEVETKRKRKAFI